MEEKRKRSTPKKDTEAQRDAQQAGYVAAGTAQHRTVGSATSRARAEKRVVRGHDLGRGGRSARVGVPDPNLPPFLRLQG